MVGSISKYRIDSFSSLFIIFWMRYSYSCVVIGCSVMGEVNPSPAVQQCPKIIWSCFRVVYMSTLRNSIHIRICRYASWHGSSPTTDVNSKPSQVMNSINCTHLSQSINSSLIPSMFMSNYTHSANY